MMRSVSPWRTRCAHGARAGTISSSTRRPGKGSAGIESLAVEERAQALGRGVAERIVGGRQRTAPRRKVRWGHAIAWPRIEHVGAIGEDHDHIHLRAQNDAGARRERPDIDKRLA